jgi:RNA polymerase sigma-70 factor (ECF subfamily)
MLALLLSLVSDEDSKKKITDLYNTYSSQLLYHAFRITQNKYDSEDALQETFLAIINDLDILNRVEDENIFAYLYTILKNKCDRILSKKSKSPSSLETLPEIVSAEDIEKTILKNETAIALMNSFSCLTLAQREVLILRFYDNKHSFKSIAQKLGRPYSTVLKQYRTALNKLNRVLEEKDYEE